MSESKTDKHIYSDDSPEQLRKANPWKRIAEEYENRGYKDYKNTVHPDDKSIIEKYNDPATVNEEHLLQLDIPPEPFWGNPLSAEVAILMLNPGFDEPYNVGMYSVLDEAMQKEFIKAKCSTMSMQDEWCVPDGTVMGRRLATVLNLISENYWVGRSDSKLEHVFKMFPDANKKIAIIQLLGYHSKRYKAIPKKLLEGKSLLPTQEYAIRLVRYMMARGKVLIIRSNRWFEHIPELNPKHENHYKKSVSLKHPLTPIIAPNHFEPEGWKLITDALKSKKSRAVGDIHPNGKWVWTEYAPGKFDWRVIKSKACQ